MKTEQVATPDFIEVCHPQSFGELDRLKNWLDAEGIVYYVTNEAAVHLSGAVPAVAADEIKVMVESARAEEVADMVPMILE